MYDLIIFPAGNMTIVGSKNILEYLVADGVEGDLLFTAGETFEGPTVSDFQATSGFFTVSGQDAEGGLASASGNGTGLGVDGGDISWNSMTQESNALVFDLTQDAKIADVSLSGFTSDGEDGHPYGEAGNWTVYHKGNVVGSGEFFADSADGDFDFSIALDDSEAVFDKIVIEASPFQDLASSGSYMSGQGSDFTVSGLSLQMSGMQTIIGEDENSYVHNPDRPNSEGDANYIAGGGGDDWLDGAGGEYGYLSGGSGNDILQAYPDGDYIYDGGTGWDSLEFRDKLPGETSIHVDLTQDTAWRNDTGASMGTIFDVEHIRGTNYDDLMIGDEFRNMFTGHRGDDVLSGLGGDDHLYGDEGNDSLSGGDGQDYLEGGVGRDSYDGGDGVDAARFGRDSDTAVRVDLSAGIVYDDGYGNEETITGVETLYTGSGDDILIGNAADNTFQAGTGNNTLSGGGGVDTVEYFMVEGKNSVIADLESGTALHSNHTTGETFTDSLSSIENLSGTLNNDILLGDDGDNILHGLDGNDILRGDHHGDNGGDDFLYGGQGNDILYGGGGDDLLKDREGDNFLDGEGGVDKYIAGDGDDWMVYDRNDFVGANLHYDLPEMTPEEELHYFEIHDRPRYGTDDEGYILDNMGQRLLDTVYQGGQGFDVLQVNDSDGLVDLTTSEIVNFEAIVGRPQGEGPGVDVLVDLQDIRNESGSDAFSNDTHVDPFDDSFLAIGVRSLNIEKIDPSATGDNLWTLAAVETGALLDGAIRAELEAPTSGADGVDFSSLVLNAFIFERGEDRLTVWTDLDSINFGAEFDRDQYENSGDTFFV